MNRAERRRQKKFQQADPTQLLQQGVVQLNSGNFPEAEKICKNVLAQFPQNPDALHLMGLVCHGQEKYDIAIDFLLKARQFLPDMPELHYNLGNSYYQSHNLQEAIGCFEKAIELKPDFANAYNNLGNVYTDCYRLDEAKKAFETLLELGQSSPEIYNNLGAVYRQLEDADRAIECFRKSLELNPNNNTAAHCNLGATLIWKQQNDEALKELRRAADFTHNHGAILTGNEVFCHRIKHDYEQICYLDDKGLLDSQYSDYKNALELAYEKVKLVDSKRATLSDEEIKSISPSYNSFVYIAEGQVVAGGSLNQDLNIKEIEEEYNKSRNSHSEHIYLDNFLKPEALKSLRDFCLESTIWKKDYNNGYLGSLLGEGFASPIVLQIADDLRTTFPGIFKNHQLFQAWGFKYDSTLKGINAHADFAAVNVNFWISPDEGNLDPESGGLVLWDKASPIDWTFNEYNNDEEKINQFLEESGAREIKVPHRQNRAMIFNSTLFHKTDNFKFKDNYENRRINVTFLYGQGLKP